MFINGVAWASRSSEAFDATQFYKCWGRNVSSFVGATFYHPLIVRLEKKGRQYRLHAKWLSGQVGYDHRLKILLEKASFWTLNPEEKDSEPNEKGEVTVCLDGVDWFLEGSVQDKYHVVDRYCPEQGTFKAVGIYVIKLARVPFKLPLR